MYWILPKEQAGGQQVDTFVQKVASRAGLEITDYQGLKWT